MVGHGRDAVVAELASLAPDATVVEQPEQRGTGDAVRLALEALPEADGALIVVSADTPLLSAATLAGLLDAHLESGAAATVLTAVVDDPTGYGRVVRRADGSVDGIVEDRDADPDQRAIAEINSGVYAFDAGPLAAALTRVGTANSQGEHYLTDVVALLRADGRTVSARVVADAVEVLGVNDRVQLAAVGAHLRDRVLAGWMRAGVSVVDPATTWVDVTVVLATDVTLLPGTQLHGATAVGQGAIIGPDSTLRDVVVGERASVVRSQAEGAEVGAEATVGPFAYLRPGTSLGAGGRDRRLRRDQERAHRGRLQGAPPVLRRRRRDR